MQRKTSHWFKRMSSFSEYSETLDVCSFPLDSSASLIEENMWQCENKFEEATSELQLKYADICYITFECCVQLEIIPFPDFVQLESLVPEDVKLWKSQLRNTYCEEEQNIWEIQVKDILITIQTNRKFKSQK